jgi:hypothetical protein
VVKGHPNRPRGARPIGSVATSARVHPGWVERGWSNAAGDRLVAGPQDGLVWERSDGSREVLAAPGAVTAVGWDGKAVLLTVRDAGQVALPVSAWSPDAEPGALERAGFRRLLEALGRDDAWTFDVDRRDAGQARALVPGEGARQRLTRAALAGSGRIFVAGYTGIILIGNISSRVTGPGLRWPLVVGAGVLLAGSVGMFAASAVGILRARAGVLAPVPGAVDQVPGVRPPVQLATGPDGELVIIDALSRELRLAGPAAGGVGTAVALVRRTPSGPALHALRLQVHDRSGRPDPHAVAEVPARWLVDPVAAVGALRGWLERAGVGWQQLDDSVAGASLVIAELWSSPLAGWTVNYTAGVTLAAVVLAALLGRWWLLVAVAAVAGRLAMWVLRLRDRRRWLAG